MAGLFARAGKASSRVEVHPNVFVLPPGVAMSLNQFFVTHYLNAAVTDSRRKASGAPFASHAMAASPAPVIDPWELHREAGALGSRPVPGTRW
jgi:hypothetical protein